MATNDRLPVFSESFDDGKTYRIIDSETNQPACTPAGDYIDRGGYVEEGAFIAECEVRRINEFERGILDHNAHIRAARSYRELLPLFVADGDDECYRWLYKQRQNERKTWVAIFAEYEAIRVEKGWTKVTVGALRNRVDRYAKRRKLPFRKEAGGRRPK